MFSKPQLKQYTYYISMQRFPYFTTFEYDIFQNGSM